ncbi:MAG: CoA transferase [Bacteroidia bacterium]|nr:CoA transferase [Bacteroidia bacterium]
MHLLSGIKVLELASVLAGPSVGRFFMELGAEVIKIENPEYGGDVTRKWLHPSEKPSKEPGSYYLSVNEGKKTIFLNLKNEKERDEFYGLLNDCDVFITNFPHGKEKLITGDKDFFLNRFPRLVWINILGYASDKARPAYDLIIQAESGFMDLNREPESNPMKLPVALMDILGGHQAKEAALLGLLQRDKTGRGSYFEVYLFESAFASWYNISALWAHTGHVPEASGSLHPNIAPYGEIFRTSDNGMVVLAVASDEHFKKLCHILSSPELTNNSKFLNNPMRVIHRKALYELLQNKISSFKTEDFLNLCKKENIPAGKINNLKEAALLLGKEFGSNRRLKTFPTIGFKFFPTI